VGDVRQRAVHPHLDLAEGRHVADDWDVVTIVVQVNGKLRGQVEVPNPPEKEVVLAAIRANRKVQQWIEGKEVVKEVYVPGKLVNIVVKG